MNNQPANLILEAILARCPAHFCRVTDVTTGNHPDKDEKHVVLLVIPVFLDFFNHGMTVAKQPLRTKLNEMRRTN